MKPASDTPWLHAKFKRESSCRTCGVNFFPLSFTARHHCRACLHSFCEQHSSRSLVFAASRGVDVRVCDSCYLTGGAAGGGGGGAAAAGAGGASAVSPAAASPPAAPPPPSPARSLAALGVHEQTCDKLSATVSELRVQIASTPPVSRPATPASPASPAAAQLRGTMRALDALLGQVDAVETCADARVREVRREMARRVQRVAGRAEELLARCEGEERERTKNEAVDAEEAERAAAEAAAKAEAEAEAEAAAALAAAALAAAAAAAQAEAEVQAEEAARQAAADEAAIDAAAAEVVEEAAADVATRLSLLSTYEQEVQGVDSALNALGAEAAAAATVTASPALKPDAQGSPGGGGGGGVERRARLLLAQLDALIVRVDAVESGGVAAVRAERRRVVALVEATTVRIEALLAALATPAAAESGVDGGGSGGGSAGAEQQQRGAGGGVGAAAAEPAGGLKREKEPPPPSAGAAGGGAGAAVEAASAPSGVSAGAGSEECVVCLDKPKEGAFLPCGHRACCMECGERMVTLGHACPICRKEPKLFMRIFT